MRKVRRFTPVPSLVARVARQKRRIHRGKIGYHHVAEHGAVVWPGTLLTKVAAENCFECVLIGGTEYAERTD